MSAFNLREADPWAAISPERADQLGARALRHVREVTTRGRARKQRWVIALAVLGSSLALAALEDSLRVKTEPPSPPVGERAGVRGASVEAPPKPIEPKAVEPKRAPPPAVKLAPKQIQQTDPLEAESKLLLKAVRQLRAEKNASAARTTLDEYDRRFPRGTLRGEAESLRHEADGDEP